MKSQTNLDSVLAELVESGFDPGLTPETYQKFADCGPRGDRGPYPTGQLAAAATVARPERVQWSDMLLNMASGSKIQVGRKVE